MIDVDIPDKQDDAQNCSLSTVNNEEITNEQTSTSFNIQNTLTIDTVKDFFP